LVKRILRNRFFKDNSYLLVISFLLLVISIFTQRTDTKNFFKKTFTKKIENHIHKAEADFKQLTKDTTIINALIENRHNEAQLKQITGLSQYIYVYKTVENFTQLTFWSTQAVLPDSTTIAYNNNNNFTVLTNGYFFVQKKNIDNYTIISLLPIKWNYAVTNDYLRNDFVVGAETGADFDISIGEAAIPISTKDSSYVFSLKAKNAPAYVGENELTIWLRLLSFLPLCLFIHFTAVYINQKRGILKASLFLIVTLLLLRTLTYIFSSTLNLRQFELFDPSIYGSDIILRSLGDLLINALLFLWTVNFVRNNINALYKTLELKKTNYKWAFLIVLAFIILFATYTTGAVIRSMVADSQISFDVMNFFSLNIYSVVGFLVLCSIAIGYYYFSSMVFFFVKKMFNNSIIPFFLIVVIMGLGILSFRIGNLSGGFELYELLWLLVFLLFINNDLSGFFSKGLVVSKMVFWLFFFSASIASVIISENSTKELRNRKRYAEVIAAKTNPISDILLNTILTELRTEVLAPRFNLFRNPITALQLRDSLVNNNLNSYTDNYETKILAYDSLENPLNNEDPVSFSTITSILNTQAKPSTIPDMYYYDAGFDKFNYITRREIKNESGAISGYVFIVVSPKILMSEKLYPELFSRGKNNSLENSSEYAYAIYEDNKLISSYNDYAFTSRYSEKNFVGKQFLLEDNAKYNELWYNAGSGKYVLIAKENKLMIELITLFSYLFCMFILLNGISSFITLLLRARFKWDRIQKEIQLTIRQQVHGTIISFSVFSFLIIGIATFLFFTSRYQNNNKEILSRTIKIIGKDVTASVPKKMIQETLFDNGRPKETGDLSSIINRLSQVHGHDINLYSIAGDLKASSLSLPYEKGIVSTKIDPQSFYHLNAGKEIQYYQKEQIGKLDFVSDYIPVTDSSGQEIAYLNIPYFTSETKLKEEISSFLVTIIILNAFILLIAGIVAIIIANRITNSFSFISDRMKKINLAKRNETIEWNKNDEIGALVNEYNKMVGKLDESAAVLARTERENAWQEMAKQVAHEIKNPLTPMKLSMQFLKKAIDEDAPNIKELSTKVSNTLVEQMDHLSNIAGEFSRFANIEKSNPERFNINDVVISVKQLYEGDTSVDFVWKYSPNEVFIYADKTHINRILTNLILNGIQAVNGDIKPSIHIQEIVKDNVVTIQITDNGSGIPAEMHDKIFMPNFTTKTSGTGLGLSMCKRMAEQAGGDISFETSDNGTSFFVTLPLG
jgi:two-component system, NtrC family, nitrogen regulation sensor histidine kinase NtrY